MRNLEKNYIRVEISLSLSLSPHHFHGVDLHIRHNMKKLTTVWISIAHLYKLEVESKARQHSKRRKLHIRCVKNILDKQTYNDSKHSQLCPLLAALSCSRNPCCDHLHTDNKHAHTHTKVTSCCCRKNRDFKTNDSFEFGESGSNFLLLGSPDIQTPTIHIPNCKLQIAQSLVPNSLQELVIMDCVCASSTRALKTRKTQFACLQETKKFIPVPVAPEAGIGVVCK